jgi:hypothetical protein
VSFKNIKYLFQKLLFSAYFSYFIGQNWSQAVSLRKEMELS